MIRIFVGTDPILNLEDCIWDIYFTVRSSLLHCVFIHRGARM